MRWHCAQLLCSARVCGLDGCGHWARVHWTSARYPPVVRSFPAPVPSSSTELSTACVRRLCEGRSLCIEPGTQCDPDPRWRAGTGAGQLSDARTRVRPVDELLPAVSLLYSQSTPITPSLTPSRVSARQGLLLDAVGQLGHLVVDGAALGHQRSDLPLGVHDRCVVAAAELLADLGERHLGELAAQVHADLPGGHQHARPGRATQVVDRQAEVGGGLT